MKPRMQRLRFVLAFCSIGSLRLAAQESALRYDGSISSGGTVLIVLYDRASGETSPWLKIGQEWHHYRVDRLDSAAEALTVVRDGQTSTLKLRAGQTRDAEPVSNATTIIPELVKGSLTVVDGKLVYSPDAVVKVEDFVISARNGSMISDGVTITGNLSVETANGTTVGDNATIRLKNGKPVLTGKKLGYIPAAARAVSK